MQGGILRKGDKITVLPSGFTSKIKDIHFGEKELAEAFVPMSCSILLEDDIDVSRGDMIVRENNVPKHAQDIDAMICWMGDKPIALGQKFVLKHNTNEVRAIVKEVKYKMDINNLSRIQDQTELKMNEIGRVLLRTTKPLYFDSYTKNRNTGSFILIDEATNVTVGAGMINDNNL
jgi:bifunctional enzyme CysN/CysC/sulfate adenylyltransferase subunit 1